MIRPGNFKCHISTAVIEGEGQRNVQDVLDAKGEIAGNFSLCMKYTR